MGQDPTTFEAWSGPNIAGPAYRQNFGKVKKSVTDVFAMSPDILIGHCIPFQPIKRQSDLFSWPYGGLILHVVCFAVYLSLYN